MQMIKQAFTLVELLIVMFIIILLSSLILAVVGVGGTSADINSTKTLVYTVSTTVEQYIHETGAVPLPTGSAADANSGTWYPDENDGSWEKQQLWWRLNHKMTVQERADMRTAGETANLAADPLQSIDYMRAQYPATATRFTEIKSIMDTVDNTLMESYKVKDTSGWVYTTASGDIHNNATYLSTRGKYKVWHLNIKGAIAKNLAERAYMTYPCLDMEELGGDIYLNDQTIVDAWGNPLIYIAHSTVEVEEKTHTSRYYRPIGARSIGRVEMKDRNGDGNINTDDWLVDPIAAEQVDHNGDGSTDADDWSSILWNAKPGNGIGFFLSSAGPDEKFNCIFAHSDNEDNIDAEIGKEE